MANYKKISTFCSTCNKQVLAEKKAPNHILHLLLTIFTLSAWGIVWLILTLLAEDSPKLCSQCGHITDKDQIKKLSIRLLIGIVFAPYIFAWFTLKSGYSTKTRALSMVYMIVYYMMFLQLLIP